jgi:hypothetical protein
MISDEVIVILNLQLHLKPLFVEGWLRMTPNSANKNP